MTATSLPAPNWLFIGEGTARPARCRRGRGELAPGGWLGRRGPGGGALIARRRVRGGGRDGARSAAACRREVAREHRLCLRVLVGRAELDDLGAGRHDRDVPGRRVIGVAGLV